MMVCEAPGPDRWIIGLRSIAILGGPRCMSVLLVWATCEGSDVISCRFNRIRNPPR